MKKPAVGAVAALVVVVVGIGSYALVRNKDDGSTTSSTTSTSAFVTSTTTSTTVPATTSTTTAKKSTTTVAKATSTTTAKPTTTTGVVAACGNGKATVSFTAKDLATDALSSTFTPEVTVDNQVSAAIEVDVVTLEVTYPSNEVRTVHFTTAGTVIGPGTSASFTADKLTSAQRYQSVRFTTFAYFTSGLKANCRVST